PPQQPINPIPAHLCAEVCTVYELTPCNQPARIPPDEVDVCKRAGGIPGEIQGLRLQQNQLLVAENRRRGGVRRIHLEPERRAETDSTYRRQTGRKGADLSLIPQVWLPQHCEMHISQARRM